MREGERRRDELAMKGAEHKDTTRDTSGGHVLRKKARRITDTAMLKSSTVEPMLGSVGSAELQNTYLSMMKKRNTRLITHKCAQ